MSGTLFVISAPSGAGKTTLLKRIMAEVPNLGFSVSHTTRPPRPGEGNGVDYHFVSREEFLAMREAGAFLEWAEVHTNLYGTSRQAVADKLATGVDLFLDIDVQGARQIKEARDLGAVFLFVAPPSWQELEKRLSGRGTEAAETVRIRLANARKEMAEAHWYDYLIVNDDLTAASVMLKAVILAERCRGRRDANGAPVAIPSP
ncbi:MAG: guanylate kinase [Thermodesulfobacteriota bacterium]|jgi:guanylate kinase